jgi:sigma-54 specific flagellar transcriptional regulator A
MITMGSFRQDLYYRLNVFPIEMPSLRERSSDIPNLLNELITRLEHNKRGSVRFNSAAIRALCMYSWPGNVRELANLVERMAIMHPDTVVGVHDLPRQFQLQDEVLPPFTASEVKVDKPLVPVRSDVIEDYNHGDNPDPAIADSDRDAGGRVAQDPHLLPMNGLDLKEYLANLERNLIEQALDDCSGVVARAADRLNIRRTTLVEKMRKYDMNR